MRISRTSGFMSIQFFFLLLFSAAQVDAQEQLIHLDFSDQPNRSVRTVTHSSNELSMFVKGDPELTKKNQARGFLNPFKISQYSTNITTFSTAEKATNGDIPFQMSIDEILSYSENENGDRINLPSPMEKFLGLKVQGITTSDGIMKVRSLEGANLNAEQKDMLTNVFSSMNTKEKTPDHPLRIGDSFETQQPMAIPFPNGPAISLNSISNYKLVKIENNKAIFDVSMRFEMVGKPANLSINASGGGSGVMEYNINTHLKELYRLKMEMEMRINADGKLDFSSKVKGETSIEQFIADPKSKSIDQGNDPFRSSQVG